MGSQEEDIDTTQGLYLLLWENGKCAFGCNIGQLSAKWNYELVHQLYL